MNGQDISATVDVLIAGAGPAGLYAADRLSSAGLSVTVIDRMPSPARKFLMAGRGGLNLTHSEDLSAFHQRYREAADFLAPMIEAFPPAALRDWCHGLGQETFIGSSGRVFPKSMKASPLLRSLLIRLGDRGVKMLPRHSLSGFAGNGQAIVSIDGKTRKIKASAILLALGGASWPKLGSNAAWTSILTERGIAIRPFEPSNCGFLVDWSSFLKDRFAGTPLKRISVTVDHHTVRGEALISEKGIEGGAIYALSAEIRDRIKSKSRAEIALDLRPDVALPNLTEKLSRPRGKQSLSGFLRKAAGLGPPELALLHEAGPVPSDTEALAARIKDVRLIAHAPYPMDRAISSAGGICFHEIDDRLMLNKLPGVFVAGEMLDWEAPTGGYLLQACFATAHRASGGVISFLEQMPDKDPQS